MTGSPGSKWGCCRWKWGPGGVVRKAFWGPCVGGCGERYGLLKLEQTRRTVPALGPARCGKVQPGLQRPRNRAGVQNLGFRPCCARRAGPVLHPGPQLESAWLPDPRQRLGPGAGHVERAPQCTPSARYGGGSARSLLKWDCIIWGLGRTRPPFKITRQFPNPSRAWAGPFPAPIHFLDLLGPVSLIQSDPFPRLGSAPWFLLPKPPSGSASPCASVASTAHAPSGGMSPFTLLRPPHKVSVSGPIVAWETEARGGRV